MARVSIKDIAERLGVSNASVSLVLNGKERNGRISSEVAERIRQAAKEMNYRPNTAAQSLRTGRTKTLGLIVADISNPFFSKMARSIENIAGAKGYQVMFGSSDESNIKFQSLVNLFIEKNVDGIILAPPQDSESAVMQLINRRIPSVLIDRGLEELPVSSVQIDNANASYNLTKYLIDEGCRRIGFMAYNMELPNMKKRYEGYIKALANSNIELDKALVRSVVFENFEENVNIALKDLLSREVDSLFFATNRVGVQSLIFLKRNANYSNLKYVSIDNADEYQLSGIPITCIDQPIGEISDRALSILFRRIEEPEYDIVENIMLHTRIM